MKRHEPIFIRKAMMMAKLVLISEMLNYYGPHAVMTNGMAPGSPPVNQFGYVMGGDGRIATDGYLRLRAKASYPDSWMEHYKDTLRWLGREVYDCNAAAEAFYKRQTGIDINTKACLNYANWCSERSVSKPEGELAGMPQLPGIAVFAGGSSASGITHVGYLFRKYGPDPLDWYVLEFRGRLYGCVLTRLKDREWRYWGKMNKYFEYDVDATWSPIIETEDGFMVIKRGMKDSDKKGIIAGWQYILLTLGKKIGRYVNGKFVDDGTADESGVDGSFGPVIERETKLMQQALGLPQTGQLDDHTLHAGIMAVIEKGGDVAAVAIALQAANAKITAAKAALA